MSPRTGVPRSVDAGVDAGPRRPAQREENRPVFASYRLRRLGALPTGSSRLPVPRSLSLYSVQFRPRQ